MEFIALRCASSANTLLAKASHAAKPRVRGFRDRRWHILGGKEGRRTGGLVHLTKTP